MTDPGIAKMAKLKKGKRIERFDAGAAGLALRITDNGTKTWCISYHLPDEQGRLKHHRFTIGPWAQPRGEEDLPEGLYGVASARGEARRIKALVRAGIDPKAALAAEQNERRTKAQKEARKTFEAIAENYIKIEIPKQRRGAETEAIIRRELLPPWGTRHTASFQRSDLTKLTDQLIAAGKPAAARRVYETATLLFNWALDRGDIDTSPFTAMKPPVKKVPRDRALKEHEITVLWAVWSKQAYPFGPLQQLLLLLGQRRSEVAEMLWSEINFQNQEWTIPAERSKSNREHIVPLSDAAVEILENLPRFGDGDFVFSTTNGRRPVSGFSKSKVRTDQMLAERKTVIKNWRVHDLRRTCRTGLAKLGVAEIVSERVLNHQVQGLVRTYNVHEYMDEKRDALKQWAGHVRDLIEPPPENVVRLQSPTATAKVP